MNRVEEFKTKWERLRGLISEKQAGGILLSRRSTFAWLTCGGQNYVVAASEGGVGSLLVTKDAVYIVSNNIENHRLLEEETVGLPVEPVSYPWELESTEKPAAIKKILAGNPLAADGAEGDLDVTTDLMHLRHPLLPPEVDRYRELGRETEAVMVKVCRSLKPGMTEYQVAAKLAEGCLEIGLDATVRLVAFDERIEKYRHPIPTGKKLEARAMVVLCARRAGLIANLTRLVNFKPVDADLRRRHDAVCRVDTAFNLASKPGAMLSDIFARGVAQYEAEGYGDEWRLHHQGGTTGYEGRDVKGSPGCEVCLHAPTAVAWNPSIRGTKSEDTFLVTDAGVENLTVSKDWPQVQSETDLGTRERCDILEV
jgi:Xaa-Pro aminopeptidase